jgi:hypothetical protein
MSSGGQVVGGLVGAVAGFFLGGGTPSGALYGAQIGMTLGGYLDPPKGPTVNGPRLNDLSVQTSTYGAVIPRVYGTVTVNGNVFWLENNRLKETVTKKKSGGKGGGGKTTTRTYTYSATFAVGLCQGPIVGVRRIWIGPDLIYDAGSSDPDTLAASNAAASGFQLYFGTDTQAPDARMQATLGVANTPAWRGLAYIVFYDLALERYANSLAGAQVRVEAVAAGHFDVVSGNDEAFLSTTPSSYFTNPDWDAAGAQWYIIRSSGGVLTSPDGGVWTERANIGNKTWRYVTKANGLFFASGKTALATSADLITWNITNVTANFDTGYVFGPANLWISHRSGSSTVLRTPDGISWLASANLPGSLSAASVGAWNDVVFCIAGNRSGSPFFVTTTDTLVWAETAAPAGVDSLVSICVGANSNFLAIGLKNAGNVFRASMSPNGVSWTPWVDIVGNVNFFVAKPAWSGSEYVLPVTLVGAASNSMWMSSPDGTSWALHEVSLAYTAVREAPVWNGSWWLAANSSAWISAAITSSVLFFRPGGVASSTLVGDPDALADIVSAECLQSGLLTSGDIDVTALTASVRGYRVGSIGAIRSAIEPLQAAWPFDVVQHGYVIRFVARGGASVVTIPAADLDARGAGQEPGVQITTSREMDSQLPRRVTVQHLDYDREHNAGTQYAERLNTAAINALVLDLPIVLTATEAAGKAEVLLYLYWLERYDVAVTLPPTYNQLEPGDVVTLVTPEGNVSLRLTAIHYTSDGRIACHAKYASAAIYTPTAVGASPAVSGATTITPVAASVYVLMDVPMVSSAQSGPSFLVAMTGALAEWRGGVLMQSTDAGSTWASLQDFGPPGSALGTCTNSIGVVEHRVIDNASVLNVTLAQGELFSVTQLAMLGGANHFAYGANGRWEIIAAQTCTLVSGTSYVLQNLLRGRFGSEWAMGLHAGGDALVPLDTADVAAIAMSSGSIGLSYLYRGVTVDRDISTDANRAFAYQGVNLKPLSPIALTGNRDPSSNDWTLTWVRRTRDGGEWRDYVDASLGEATESYAIDVYADSTYAAVKRTITASAPSCVYARADQVSDFGANQATLYLKLSQISATVGRGYPLTTSITR